MSLTRPARRADVRREDLLVAGLALLGALVVAIDSVPRYSSRGAMGPGAVPLLLAIVIALCAAGLLVRAVRERALATAVSWPRGPQLRRVALSAGSLAAYVLAIPVIGFPVATALLLLVFLRVLGDYRWRVAVPLALGGALVMWYAFGVLLYMPLPRGWPGL